MYLWRWGPSTSTQPRQEPRWALMENGREQRGTGETYLTERASLDKPQCVITAPLFKYTVHLAMQCPANDVNPACHHAGFKVHGHGQSARKKARGSQHWAVWAWLQEMLFGVRVMHHPRSRVTTRARIVGIRVPLSVKLHPSLLLLEGRTGGEVSCCCFACIPFFGYSLFFALFFFYCSFSLTKTFCVEEEGSLPGRESPNESSPWKGTEGQWWRSHWTCPSHIHRQPTVGPDSESSAAVEQAGRSWCVPVPKAHHWKKKLSRYGSSVSHQKREPIWPEPCSGSGQALDGRLRAAAALGNPQDPKKGCWGHHKC